MLQRYKVIKSCNKNKHVWKQNVTATRPGLANVIQREQMDLNLKLIFIKLLKGAELLWAQI